MRVGPDGKPHPGRRQKQYLPKLVILSAALVILSVKLVILSVKLVILSVKLVVLSVKARHPEREGPSS